MLFCHCRYYRRDRDATNFEKKLLAAEAQVNDLQARLSDAVNQRKHWENEYNVRLFIYFFLNFQSYKLNKNAFVRKPKHVSSCLPKIYM